MAPDLAGGNHLDERQGQLPFNSSKHCRSRMHRALAHTILAFTGLEQYRHNSVARCCSHMQQAAGSHHPGSDGLGAVGALPKDGVEGAAAGADGQQPLQQAAPVEGPPAAGIWARLIRHLPCSAFAMILGLPQQLMAS